MEARFVSGPFASGTSFQRELVDALASPDYQELTVAVAWAKLSGLRLIEPWLREFAKRGAVRFLVGIDDRLASADGLELLLSFGPHSAVVYDPNGGIFHPKVYRFAGEERALVIVGSTNLTSGGVLGNYEASTSTRLSLSDAADSAFLGQVDAYLSTIRADATTLPLTSRLIEDLLAAGVVTREGGGRKAVPHRKSASPAARALGFRPSRQERSARIPAPKPTWHERFGRSR
jgi:HKD family nuclease